MRKIEFSKRFWTSGTAALGILAGLALAPAPAQAQICGDPDEIAEDLLDAYFDEFEDFFNLSENTCDSMASVFLKACNAAVKDSVKCADRVIDSIPKAAKSACKEAAKNPSGCDQEFKESANNVKAFVEIEANFAYSDCEVAAEEFFEECRFDF